MREMLAVVSEPNRQKILQLVWREEKSAGEIAGQFQTSFGAVSQHLKVLRDHGLIDLRKQGRAHFYKANHQNLGPLAQYLETLWWGHLHQLKALAEDAELLKKPRN